MILKSGKYLDSGAQLSGCKRYRYTLWRIFDETLPSVAFVGLNPSTADASLDDPTIRRCVGFAHSLGYGGIVMLNLFAWRSTDPNGLYASDPNGEEENVATISRVSEQVPRVIAAWGAHQMAKERSRMIVPLVSEWWCLGTTKNGAPRHPLYLPNTASIRRWP